MMSTLTQYFKRLAHSRSRRRLAVSKSTKLKFTDPSTDLVTNSDPENAKNTGNVPALQEPQHKVTHLYKGRKVMKFDSKRSRSHIEKMILIRSCSKTRRREGKILLEGKKLITDAIVQGNDVLDINIRLWPTSKIGMGNIIFLYKTIEMFSTLLLSLHNYGFELSEFFRLCA